MKRLSLIIALVTGCVAPDLDGDREPDGIDPGDPGDPDDAGDPGQPEPVPGYAGPAACPPAPSVDTDWDHDIASAAVAALGSAYHGTADAIANPGSPVTVRGRFVYSLALKDLEDETVLAYVEHGDCQWQLAGEAITDSDGVAELIVGGEHTAAPGAYNVELVVRGDDSRVRGALWVVGAGTDVVVVDIDGTMTTGDSEIVEEVLTGAEPEMREAADQVVARYRAAGYLPVFVTGRPMYLDVMTRDWLDARGLGAAPLFLTAGFTEGILDVEDFKRETLLDLEARAGLDLQFAYGNASTDVCAYATAGIDPAVTHIIGDHRGDACPGFTATVPLTDYPSHLAGLAPPLADHR